MHDKPGAQARQLRDTPYGPRQTPAAHAAKGAPANVHEREEQGWERATSGVRQLPPTGSEEVAPTLISVIRAADPETSAHYLGGTPHTAGLPQGR